MSFKKYITLILAVVMATSLVACQKDDSADDTQGTSTTTTTTTIAFNEEITDAPTDTETQPSDASSPSEESSTSATVTTQKKSDSPAEWSKAQIIDFYKKAASKSNSTATTDQAVTIKEISVNNGEHKEVFEFITPIMSKLIANNTESKDGITGGYSFLCEADVKSAKAYKSGDKTVIELTLKDQVSGASDNPMEGSVGHAITAVGDLSVVIKEMKDLGLPLDIPEKNTKINYTNATVKVVVDSNGKIVNGTWSYRVSINLNDYKAFGKPVDSTRVVMDNVLTVNGGFKK